MKTINEIREALVNTQNEMDAARQRGMELVADANASTADMEAQVATIQNISARLHLLKQELHNAENAGAARMQQQAAQQGTSATDDAATNPRLARILASREYARAFAYAIRNGVSVASGRGNDQLGVLYDALKETGGSPEGADGGFLVPEEINYQIREQRRQLITLSSLFDVQPVSTNKGQYTKDVAPTSGFTKLDGEIPSGGVPMDDQPKFARVPYTLDTYGLNIPISNELVADEVAGLFTYLSRFFAKKHVLTENKLLLELLAKKEATEVDVSAEANDAMRKLKYALNVTLDPEISMNAAILTNQSGFDFLDQLEDAKGRPMLQPDPTSGTPMLFKSHRVVVASDALLPNPEEKKLPIYIGDFKQYGTLWMRQPLEIASTNIGGNAWRTNSTEVRGITRLGTSVFDEDAAVYMTLKTEAE